MIYGMFDYFVVGCLRVLRQGVRSKQTTLGATECGNGDRLTRLVDQVGSEPLLTWLAPTPSGSFDMVHKTFVWNKALFHRHTTIWTLAVCHRFSISKIGQHARIGRAFGSLNIGHLRSLGTSHNTCSRELSSDCNWEYRMRVVCHTPSNGHSRNK